MCGIAGILGPSNTRVVLEGQVRLMADTIAHRGPDESGLWADPGIGVALAHRRLSIIDLSPAGSQPMTSASGRYVIVFNGEIYNHQDLRRDLERSSLLRRPWRGRSDTETLLVAIEAWGLSATLQRTAGMFALALWDRHEQVLNLALDRFGEKPLYWGLCGTGASRALVFASEPAALRSYPGFNNSINHQALAEFLRLGYVPAPLSIYSGIAKLAAGHLLTIPFPLGPDLSLPVSRPWWQFNSIIESGKAAPFQSDSDALHCLEQQLKDALVDLTISDVPLGAFLSGGIDSSLIAALLQNQSRQPIRTFTIGFEEDRFNEAPFARAVADHLGTSHSETLLTSAEARALIPQLPLLYSEPFADSSQLPTHLACRSAREAGLSVVLSGDGGDELFGGYSRYFWAPRVWNRVTWLPYSVRQSLGRAITRVPPSFWNPFEKTLKVSQIGHKVHKFAERLRSVDNSDDLYLSPFISIIVTTFDSESTIYSCLDSIFSQTKAELISEVIVVDDASTDSTLSLLESYSHPLRIFTLPINSGGPAKPRNIGISNSVNNTLCFVDSDDTLTPNWLEQASIYLGRRENSALIISGYHFSCLSNKYIGTSWFTQNCSVRVFDHSSLIALGNPVAFSGTLVTFSHELSKHPIFKETSYYSGLEDYSAWLELTNKGFLVYKVNACAFSSSVSGQAGISQDNHYSRLYQLLSRYTSTLPPWLLRLRFTTKLKIYLKTLTFDPLIGLMVSILKIDYIFLPYYFLRKSPSSLPGLWLVLESLTSIVSAIRLKQQPSGLDLSQNNFPLYSSSLDLDYLPHLPRVVYPIATFLETLPRSFRIHLFIALSCRCIRLLPSFFKRQASRCCYPIFVLLSPFLAPRTEYLFSDPSVIYFSQDYDSYSVSHQLASKLGILPTSLSIIPTTYAFPTFSSLAQDIKAYLRGLATLRCFIQNLHKTSFSNLGLSDLCFLVAASFYFIRYPSSIYLSYVSQNIPAKVLLLARFLGRRSFVFNHGFFCLHPDCQNNKDFFKQASVAAATVVNSHLAPGFFLDKPSFSFVSRTQNTPKTYSPLVAIDRSNRINLATPTKSFILLTLTWKPLVDSRYPFQLDLFSYIRWLKDILSLSKNHPDYTFVIKERFPDPRLVELLRFQLDYDLFFWDKQPSHLQALDAYSTVVTYTSTIARDYATLTLKPAILYTPSWATSEALDYFVDDSYYIVTDICQLSSALASIP